MIVYRAGKHFFYNCGTYSYLFTGILVIGMVFSRSTSLGARTNKSIILDAANRGGGGFVFVLVAPRTLFFSMMIRGWIFIAHRQLVVGVLPLGVIKLEYRSMTGSV